MMYETTIRLFNNCIYKFMFIFSLKKWTICNKCKQRDADILHMYKNNRMQNKFLLKYTWFIVFNVNI
jgi:hypothetical protein